MNHRDAEEAAIKISLKHPDEVFFVNWIEDNEYAVETSAEFPWQECYIAGELVYIDDEI